MWNERDWESIKKLEKYFNSGLGIGIEMDGHTGYRCQITSYINENGETISEAIENAIEKYNTPEMQSIIYPKKHIFNRVKWNDD